MKSMAFRHTAIGRVGIAESGGALTNLYFVEEAVPDLSASGGSPLIDEAFGQLEEWLAGERDAFDLPLAPGGTEFMEKVWRAVQAIPYARTASYSEIAAAVGSPGAARAVGSACSRNPLPIFIPCHRVIGQRGDHAGYVGGLDLKKLLLRIEREHAGLA